MSFYLSEQHDQHLLLSENASNVYKVTARGDRYMHLQVTTAHNFVMVRHIIT